MNTTSYDIVFTLSTYKSCQIAINFLRSLKFLQANVLPILVSPIENDLEYIYSQTIDIPVVYILSDFNSLHMGRAWGFVWAFNNNIRGRYLASCDDDIEFYEPAKDILSRLDQADQQIGFSLMAFRSTHPQWDAGMTHIHDEIKVGLNWLDGNCIFSKWQDNVDFGVIDALPEVPMCYFVELEYSHRMRFLTGRPLVYDVRNVYYQHIFRADPQINAQRALNSDRGLVSGNQFWVRKFGLQMMDINSTPGIHEHLYKLTTTSPGAVARYTKHLLFDGEWNDWEKIYAGYVHQTRVVHNNSGQ